MRRRSASAVHEVCRRRTALGAFSEDAEGISGTIDERTRVEKREDERKERKEVKREVEKLIVRLERERFSDYVVVV